MKISKKRTAQLMVFAIALLLVLALSIGITGAWYQAKRQASGTVIMDQGIIIDYKGFAENAAATTWGKGVTLNLFAITDAQPGQNIAVNASSIKANAESVDFYARVKLGYEFYDGETKLTEETLTAASFNVSDLITTSANFFGDSWVESSDGWFYYGAGTALDKLNPSDLDTAFVALFADGAKFIIEGENFVGADNEGQGGGFKIDETTSINKIVIVLTLETLQGSADTTVEGWEIVPVSKSTEVIEDFSSNSLTDTSGAIVSTDLAEGTTYQVVDNSGNGYKFTITNSTATGQAQTLASVDVSVVNGEATVTGWVGSPTDLIIPDYITTKGKVYKVTSIGDWAFVDMSDEENPVGCTSLTSVKIPNTLTSIGIGAFGMCSNLTSISMGNGVTSIGENAFAYSGLTSVIIPDSVESIGQDAFTDCAALSITIGSGVTSMGDFAFRCPNLTEVIIKDGATEIGFMAFNGCSNLTSVTIGNGVTSIGSDAFQDCSGLTSITIPDSVTSIGNGAFAGCTNLATINIGAGVTDATWLPSSATNVTISENNENIATDGKAIFTKKTGNVLELTKFFAKTETSYSIPSKLTLNGVDWNVTNIGRRAFYNCSGLTSITIPDSVTSIEVYAFLNCSGLTSITIPDSVTSIEAYAFYNCSGLTSITIPDSVTSIGFQAFKDCSVLTSVTIGSGVTAIPSSCFYNCSALETVVIKGEITEIGSKAFYGCSGLTLITIPDSVMHIRNDAFNGCSGLTSITIPDSVSSIDSSAFTGCNNLSEVIIDSKNVAWGGNNSDLFSNATKVYVKTGLTVGNYITGSFTETTSDKEGYVLYTK